MDSMIITKEMLEEHAGWLDKFTFVTSLAFKDFPSGLLKSFADLIEDNDINSGYLCCEYWFPEDENDIENFVYSFIFEDDSISVNDFFKKPLYNNMVKEIAVKMGKEED